MLVDIIKWFQIRKRVAENKIQRKEWRIPKKGRLKI